MEQHNEHTYAHRAFSLMEEHDVLPTPENYAVWFHYAEGKNQRLCDEINSIIADKLPFNKNTCSYLHGKYIAVDHHRQSVDDAAQGAQKILQDVLKVVSNFSSETKTYNQGVDKYLDDISTEFTNDNIKKVVKGLIEATVTLKQSGANLNKKLEESTKEITSLKKNLEQVTVESQRDFLTGAYNRKTFERLFDEHVMQAGEYKGDLCLMMIDVDHFKQFNDKFGHLLGDEVLKIVARTLTDSVKGRDVVARFGGEEFVIILPDTPIDAAVKVAEMIRTAIASKELKRKDTGAHFGTITVSMGIARWHAGDSLLNLIKRADDALYQSKRNGRNRVTRDPLS